MTNKGFLKSLALMSFGAVAAMSFANSLSVSAESDPKSMSFTACSDSPMQVEGQGGPGQGGFGQGQRGGGPGGPGQGPGQGQMRGPGPMQHGGPVILTNPAVEKELRLSEEQKMKIREILEKYRPKPPQGGGQQGPPQGPPQGDETPKKINAELKRVLDEKQFKRYMQLDLQAAGPFAFARPEVGQALSLTEEQNQRIHEILGRLMPPPPGGQGGGFGGPGGGGGRGGGEFDEPSFGQGGRGGRQGGPGQGGGPGGPGQGGSGQGGNEMFRQAMDRIMGILNENQKAKWKSMIGEPFKFPPMGPPQGGPGGPPPGGGGQEIG